MSRNSHFESENKRLSLKVDEMKEICSLTSSLNVKYKMQLERETSEKENLKESNFKLKLKLNQLSVKSNDQSQRIKVLENSLKRKPAIRASQPQVQIIGSVKELTDPRKSGVFVDLQTRYDELDAAHQEALTVIDELEFELGDVMHLRDLSSTIFPFFSLQIDYLEMETQRLQQENEKLKEMLEQAGISYVKFFSIKI